MPLNRRLLISIFSLLAFFFLASNVHAAPVVQYCAIKDSHVTSTHCSFGNSVTSGNLLIIIGIDAYTAGVSDSLGTSFTQVGDSKQLGGGSYAISYYYGFAQSSGSDTFTISGSGNYPEIIAVEVSNIQSFDTYSTGSGSSATPSVTSYSPMSGDFILAGLFITQGPDVSAGDGYLFLTATSTQEGSAEYLTSSSGSQTSPFSLNSPATYTEISVAFVPKTPNAPSNPTNTASTNQPNAPSSNPTNPGGNAIQDTAFAISSPNVYGPYEAPHVVDQYLQPGQVGQLVTHRGCPYWHIDWLNCIGYDYGKDAFGGSVSASGSDAGWFEVIISSKEGRSIHYYFNNGHPLEQQNSRTDVYVGEGYTDQYVSYSSCASNYKYNVGRNPSSGQILTATVCLPGFSSGWLVFSDDFAERWNKAGFPSSDTLIKISAISYMDRATVYFQNMYLNYKPPVITAPAPIPNVNILVESTGASSAPLIVDGALQNIPYSTQWLASSSHMLSVPTVVNSGGAWWQFKDWIRWTNPSSPLSTSNTFTFNTPDSGSDCLKTVPATCTYSDYLQSSQENPICECYGSANVYQGVRLVAEYTPTTAQVTTTVTTTATPQLQQGNTALQKGWNLLSFPFKQLSVSNVNCLASDYVFYGWNSATQQWEKLISATTLAAGRSYWIYLSKACQISYSGTIPIQNSDIKLVSGWNAVGATSSVQAIASVKGSCNILDSQTWDASAQSWTPATQLNPLNGYWIKVSSDCRFS